MQTNHRLSVVLMKAALGGLAILTFYFSSSAFAATTASSIPATIAITPVKLQSMSQKDNIVELKSGALLSITHDLPSTLGKSLADYLAKRGLFLKVKTVDEHTLPSAASVAEMAQAGRDAESDIVLDCRVQEFSGIFEAGFANKLKEHLVIELVLYETATTRRLWHGTTSTDQEMRIRPGIMNDEAMKNKYLAMLNEQTLPVALGDLLGQIRTDMASYKPPVAQNVTVAAADFVSDVDRVPRTATTIKQDAYAVVIGIENYRDLAAAEFTVRDAKMVKEYLVRVMGFPQENIITMLNDRATKGDIEGYIGTWLKKNVDSNSTVVIYYAGHGAPNPVTGEPFLIPYDGNPAFLEASALPLKKMYMLLADLPAKEVFVFMDACFSGGGGRSVMAKGGRPVAISIENPMLATKKVVVMSAANGTQISSSYPEKKHGLFTYFFLKGLQGEADVTGDKIINIEKLYNYITPNVKKIARLNDREQTPAISPDLDVLGSIARAPLAVIGK